MIFWNSDYQGRCWILNKKNKKTSENYTSQSEFNRKKILNFLTTENIEFVDIYKKFSNIDDPLKYYPFRTKTHFTEKGYETVSNFIIDKLQKID